MMKQMTLDFVDQRIIPKLEEIDNQEEGLVPSLMRESGELGLLGSSVPEEYGGMGLDFKTPMLITEAIVGGSNRLHGLGWLSELHLAEREVVAVPLPVELLGEGIDAVDHVDAAVGVDVRGGCDLIAGQVIVTNEVLAWLVHIKAVWQLLAAKEYGEGVTTVVRVVALTDFKCIIGQVVVHYVWQVVAGGEEAENAAIVVQELFL